MDSEWKEYKFSEVIEINPQRNLKKGTIAPFIEMRAIEPNRRRPLKISRKMYSGGGAKFKNRDTLLARITPCLEHGKTVFISDLKEGEVGFGSTEFIVLTGKEGITDPLFVYYLCKYNEVRDFAIKSMTGSSGRQRVQEEAFNHLTIKVPPITEQRKIAEILGSLDDKIELNYEMNKTLEAIAQAIFKNWFVDFEPFKDKLVYNEELGKEIPKGWEITELSNIGKIITGKTPPTSDRENYGSEYLFIRIPDMHNKTFVTNTEVKLSKKGANFLRNLLLPPLSICVSCIATVGLVALTQEYSFTNQQINSVICNKDISPYYVYLYIKNMIAPRIADFGSGGSVTPILNKSEFSKLKIILPSLNILNQFHQKIESIFSCILSNEREITILEQIRDALLPKLLSGEIRVKVDVEEEFPEEAKKLEEIEEEKVKLQGSLDKWLK